MRRSISLLLALTMVFSMVPGLAFAAPVETTGNVSSAAELTAALADPTIPVITLTSDISVDVQLTVGRTVTINGGGFALTVATDLGKGDSTKHALLLSTVPETTTPTIIKNLTVDSAGKADGVHVYGAGDVTFDGVTIKNSKSVGLNVSGSNVTATDLNTSGNFWGAVNVDPGKLVVLPTKFTLVSGILTEPLKIWSDGGNVTSDATVAVDASAAGYVTVPGMIGSWGIWTLARTVNVSTVDQLEAAIRDLQPCDTIKLAAGTYDVGRRFGDLKFGPEMDWYLPIGKPGVTIQGAGADKTTLTSSVYSANGVWASQDFITVWANNVTIDGVNIVSKGETNKAIEVMGKNFTLKNSTLLTNPAGAEAPPVPFYKFAGSIYFHPDTTIAGAAGDVGTSLLQNVTVEGAWISANPGFVSAGTVAVDNLTLDWRDAFYASYSDADGTFGMMTLNPVFKAEGKGARFVVDRTMVDVKTQAIDLMPKGTVLELHGADATWVFPAGAFDNGSTAAITPGVTVTTTLDTPLRYGLTRVKLDFAQSGPLPGTIDVKVFVSKVLAGKTFDLFGDAAATGVSTQRVKIDADGFTTVSVDRGDTWYLYEYRVHTVAFNANGGSATALQSVTYGSFASLPTAPTKTGYTFAGWHKDAGLSEDWNFASDVVLNNMTLNAEFKINSYSVTFKNWDGSVLATQKVNYGSTASAPVAPARPGYVFAGWSTSFAGVKTSFATTAVYRKSLIKLFVSTPMAPATMNHASSYKVWGSMAPRQIIGSSPVRIYRYRQSASGSWVSYGYVTAKMMSGSTYCRAIVLGYAGKWKLRAYAPADKGHIAAWSAGFDYVTVR